MLLLASNLTFVPFVVPTMQNNSIDEINKNFEKIEELLQYFYKFLLNKGINMTLPAFEKINNVDEIVTKVNANFDKLNDFLVSLNKEISQINIKASDLNIDNLRFKTYEMEGKISIGEDTIEIEINNKTAKITPAEVTTANGSIELWQLI